ncbi:hypothetical protein ISCGN_021678 [Ixodes scapularis]
MHRPPSRQLLTACFISLFVCRLPLADGASVLSASAARFQKTYQDRDVDVLETADGRHRTDDEDGNEMALVKVSGPESLERRLPRSLIIGVKKAGTRALLEFLRLHPDVRASGPETHFFDRHYNRGVEWYRKQMPLSLPDQVTMEKTPSYFVTRQAPARIHTLSPRMRLLVVVRDPVTRALSDYAQTSSKRPNSTLPFEELAFDEDGVDPSWSAIRIGLYERHLSRWLEHFAPGQIHVVSGEELVRDPAQEMALVQDFLGLRRLVSHDHFYFNRTKGFPCLKKSEGSGSPHCLGKTKGRTHPRLCDSDLRRLRSFFEPYNRRFYKMVGRDFGWNGER